MNEFQYKLLETLCDYAEEDWITFKALLTDKGFTTEEIAKVDQAKYIIHCFEGIEVEEGE